MYRNLKNVKGVAASMLGLVKGILSLGKGAVTYLGAGIGIACTTVFGDVPDCLKNCKSKAAEYNEAISAIIHDPFLIVEGLSQNVNDAYEEKMVLNSLDDAGKFGDKFYGEWLKSLSAEEKEAIRIYTGNDYTKINNYLRGIAGDLDGVDPKVVENLNSALSKAKVPYNMTVYRGTDLFPFEDLYELNWNGGIDCDTLIGKTVSDKAFMSTAILENSSFNKEVLWTINIPAGSNAAYIASLSKYPAEAELLFNSGQSMVIKEAAVDSSGKLHLTLDLIKK